MRRYENSCEKLLKRNLDELEKRRSQKTDSAMEIDYLSALPAWLNSHGRLRPGGRPKSETAQPTVQPAHVEALAGTELRNETNGMPNAAAETELRNEPNGMPKAAAETELRNEPNGKPRTGAGAELRNEPNGTPRAVGDGQALRNEPDVVTRLARGAAAPRTEPEELVQQELQTQGGEGIAASGKRGSGVASGRAHANPVASIVLGRLRLEGGHENAVRESRGQRKRRERRERNAKRTCRPRKGRRVGSSAHQEGGEIESRANPVSNPRPLCKGGKWRVLLSEYPGALETTCLHQGTHGQSIPSK